MGLPWYGSAVKNLSAVQKMRGMQVRSLSQEDPLEKEMATHSSILSWKIPWAEDTSKLQPMGCKDPLKEGMATHSSILSWRIPWTEEAGGLQSMGSQRVGHDIATECSTA